MSAKHVLDKFKVAVTPAWNAVSAAVGPEKTALGAAFLCGALPFYFIGRHRGFKKGEAHHIHADYLKRTGTK